MKTRSFLFATALLVGLMACTTESQEGPEGSNIEVADILFFNGAIYTMDASRSWATSVAIRDGNIISVGFDDDIEALKGASTRVVDLVEK